MAWHGTLSLRYSREQDRTVALDRHEGPLRVLQRLYPEGPGVCHHVLVHPPGGIVGGDVLQVDLDLASRTHALVTTAGATRCSTPPAPRPRATRWSRAPAPRRRIRASSCCACWHLAPSRR
jgi:urease accessory protein UreH